MKRQGSGFTLAELLIVVAVVGVLSAIAIPVFTASIEQAREATCIANRRSFLAVLASRQIPLGTNDLAKTLRDMVAENDPDAVDWETTYVCPSGGPMRVRAETIRCDFHRAKDYQNSTKMLDRYLELKNNDTGKSNDQLRAQYFNDYCTAGGTWPKLQVGDNIYYAQPYVDIFSAGGQTPSGDTYLFAGVSQSGNGDWRAYSIYDAEEDEWYTSPKGKDIIIANKSWSTVKEKMENDGWVKTDAIEIDPIG